MIVSANKPWYRQLFRWAKTQRNWGNLVLSICTIGGFIATLFGSLNSFPWHFSVVLLFLIVFQAYYCSRYYELKHSRAKPLTAFHHIHLIAEAERELATQDYAPYVIKANEGSLKIQDTRLLIRRHLEFAAVVCRELHHALRSTGLSVDRVSLKLEIGNSIHEVANNTQSDQSWLEKRLSCEQSVMWRMLSHVHFRYQELIGSPKLRNHPLNSKLTNKPRFLAIDDLASQSHPSAFEALAAALPNRSSSIAISDTLAVELWNQLRTCVNNHYKNCIAVMICGPALQDPVTPELTGERTRQAIGFIGVDSNQTTLLDELEQAHIEVIAAVADSVFSVLTNLRSFCQSELAQHPNP